MPDRYANFSQLSASEPRDCYSIDVRDRGTAIAIAAPHGGGIEPGTSEIARAIASDEFSCYSFEGHMRTGNEVLHLTSNAFDEPQGLALLRLAECVVTVHGERSAEEVAYVGGLNDVLKSALTDALAARGFDAREHPHLRARDPRNICNAGRSGAGVQLELSAGLRRSFFESLAREGRKVRNERLAEFSALVRRVLRGARTPTFEPRARARDSNR